VKTWQTIALCFSILISVLGASFYLKYEPKTLLESNYGPVDLGKVFSEKVMLDVTLLGVNGDGTGYEKVVDGASFYEKSKPVNLAFIDIIDKLNIIEDGKKSHYETVAPTDDNVKLKIKTYITYSSSNFMSMPYIFTIKEETYPLSKGVLLKTSVEKVMNQNFEDTKAEIAKNLFITNKADYGLNSTPVANIEAKANVPASAAN
jgi:hypothetical protein